MHAAAIDAPSAGGLAPLALALRLSLRPGLCWLDGDASERDGRWSFLGADPVERLSLPLGSPAPLSAFAHMEPSAPDGASAADGAPDPAQVPRWAGYVAYDAHFEDRPTRLRRPQGRPALSFARYDALFAFDHGSGRAFVVGDDRAACDRLLARAEHGPSRMPGARAGAVTVTSEAQHRAAIARAIEHIAAGDIYQVNLARCYRAPFEGSPLALFAALRAASPVPLGMYYDDGARVVLSRTMERFLRWQRAERRLLARPIKGTIARAGGRDRAEAETLRADDKERAEHAMIVDLMRNDLGRVAEPGSVHVPQVMAVEPYAGLSHLVSTIACTTRPGTSLRQVLEATFPPGSVTGTPKLRAIDIIEALESEPRDVYTGALGFVDRAGGLSLAVAIRTALVAHGELRYFAGGGIVEGSVPEREVAETDLKARVLHDALATLAADRIHDRALSSTDVLR
jgi:anthranilate/para-aminobenzoate synthase component I